MSAPPRLDDIDVDALEPTVEVERGRLRLSLSGAPSADVVASAFTVRDVRDLVLLGGGLQDGAVRSTDAGGFSVDGDHVVVWDASETQVEISRRALRSILARAIAAVLSRRSDLSATDDDTWATLETLERSLRD